MKEIFMKKIHFMLISAIVSVFMFISCWQELDTEKSNSVILDEEINDSNLTWVRIAEATSAEVTKADANFFCKIGNGGIIVDGNKGKESGSYYVLEDGKIYEFRRLSSGVYYKGVVKGGWLPSDTVGEYVGAFSSGIHSVVLETLSYPQNVKDLGDGKFSYHRKGMGPDRDTYIFTVTDGLITEMESTVYGGSGIVMYRTFVRTYTYGGQTVTLPSEFILAVKLATPENLNIINGIITWDEVEGAYCYTVFIYKDGALMRDIRRYSADFNFDSHVRTYFKNWESDAYQIKITAVDHFVSELYESDPATVEYIYQK
jgi:uncharacterized membrane protein